MAKDLNTFAFGVAGNVPGGTNINTPGQFMPNNVAKRPNPLNGTADMQNSLGSYPKTFNPGLAKLIEEIRLISDTFEEEIAVRGSIDWYRSIFDKDTIPLHSGTLAKTYMKDMGMDDSPMTAALIGLGNGWDVKWNETSITGSSIEVTTSAWGRYYKRHAFMQDFSSIDWYARLARRFAENASRTLNNLAGMRMYEGAQYIFVKSIDAFNAQDPLAPRLNLGAAAHEVKTYLTLEALKEAKWLMENNEEPFVTVDSAAQAGAGTINSANKRRAIIRGYNGGDTYLVLLGREGYSQLLSDPQFMDTFVAHGGSYQNSVVSQTLGLRGESIFGLTFQIVDSPITLKLDNPANPTKAVIDPHGMGELEVAFVIGGNHGVRIGVELSLEGYTRIISADFNEDKKVDPFGLLAFYGWMSVTDFTVIRNEALYAIPYKRTSGHVKTGNILTDTNLPQWKL